MFPCIGKVNSLDKTVPEALVWIVPPHLTNLKAETQDSIREFFGHALSYSEFASASK
jgi:hypothetical protein